jgi:hypothetical protein
MSTTSRRLVAVAVAAIIAVLTGITVGLLAARQSCTVDTLLTPTPTSSATGTTTGTSGVGAKSTPTPSTPTSATCDGGFAKAPAVVALAGTLVGGVAVLGLLFAAAPPRRPGPAPTRPGPAGATARRPVSPAPDGPQPGRQPEADRATLVQACIYVRDRTTSKALAERLGAALHQAGVTSIEPAGVRFDPARHEAGGAAPSDDPAKVGTIAAVEVPGYADRGHLLRPPVVTVYQAGHQSDDARTTREER